MQHSPDSAVRRVACAGRLASNQMIRSGKAQRDLVAMRGDQERQLRHSGRALQVEGRQTMHVSQ